MGLVVKERPPQNNALLLKFTLTRSQAQHNGTAQ